MQLDSNGSVVLKYVYDAWGNCKVLDTLGDEITDATHIGVLNPFRYRSYYFDVETNFCFLKTRYYDPEIGSFMTIDDLSYLDPDTVNGLNLYAYCGNNPIMRLDVLGNFWDYVYNGVLTFLGVTNPINKVTGAGAVITAMVQGRWEDLAWDFSRGCFNPFNQSAETALESRVFSFYKGSSVVRHSIPQTSSCQIFGTIFLNTDVNLYKQQYQETTLNHEWGHGVQEYLIGPSYLIFVALPSAIYCNFGDYLNYQDSSVRERMYFSKIWERTADMLGGVNRNNYDPFWKITNFIFW